MELAKLTGILNLSPLLVLAVFSLLYIRPMPRLAYSSIYKNGPPGFVSEIPLYYRSRSIRI